MDPLGDEVKRELRSLGPQTGGALGVLRDEPVADDRGVGLARLSRHSGALKRVPVVRRDAVALTLDPLGLTHERRRLLAFLAGQAALTVALLLAGQLRAFRAHLDHPRLGRVSDELGVTGPCGVQVQVPPVHLAVGGVDGLSPGPEPGRVDLRPLLGSPPRLRDLSRLGRPHPLRIACLGGEPVCDQPLRVEPALRVLALLGGLHGAALRLVLGRAEQRLPCPHQRRRRHRRHPLDFLHYLIVAWHRGLRLVCGS